MQEQVAPNSLLPAAPPQQIQEGLELRAPDAGSLALPAQNVAGVTPLATSSISQQTKSWAQKAPKKIIRKPDSSPWSCAACRGRHRPHTYLEGCKKKDDADAAMKLQQRSLADQQKATSTILAAQIPMQQPVVEIPQSENDVTCPACNGKHRPHTFQIGCKKAADVDAPAKLHKRVVAREVARVTHGMEQSDVTCHACLGKHRSHTFTTGCLKKIWGVVANGVAGVPALPTSGAPGQGQLPIATRRLPGPQQLELPPLGTNNIAASLAPQQHPQLMMAGSSITSLSMPSPLPAAMVNTAGGPTSVPQVADLQIGAVAGGAVSTNTLSVTIPTDPTLTPMPPHTLPPASLPTIDPGAPPSLVDPARGVIEHTLAQGTLGPAHVPGAAVPLGGVPGAAVPPP